MDAVSNESQRDLEKLTWKYVEGLEEEKIQLLEDSSIGSYHTLFFHIFPRHSGYYTLSFL